MRGILRPAAAIAPLPDEKARSTYKRLRIQVFAGIFVGYAGYYLVRKNFSLAMAYLIYGPVMLIGLHALDLVPKKAAGTAAGLTGLF